MRISRDTPVIVTGGASGLGAAVARAFAELGAPVGVLDQRAPDAVPHAFAACDVTDSKAVTAALLQLRSEIGQERICVNCAGISPAAKAVSRGAAHDPQLFGTVVGVNLTGTFNVATQSALGMSGAGPLNDDGERGLIINTSSIAAFEGQMGQLAYAASKAGVAGLTLPMARDLARLGIRVMAIAPGIFGTPMVTAFPQEVQDGLARASVFPRRLGRPEEFASLACHIATNSMLNGEVIRLDGATRMQAQ